MKKIFLVLFCVLCFSSVCSAQRIDAQIDSSGYKVVMLKAKLLKEYDRGDGNNKMLNFFYEQSEQALYVSAHGDSKGRLYLQKNRRTKETVAQCVDRLIEENANLFNGLTVRKVYLMSCYEEARHQDNPKNLYIGHSDVLNVDIYEISRYCSLLENLYKIENGYIYSISYDQTNSNPLADRKIYKLAKNAAEDAGATWAVEMLKNNKQF